MSILFPESLVKLIFEYHHHLEYKGYFIQRKFCHDKIEGINDKHNFYAENVIVSDFDEEKEKEYIMERLKKSARDVRDGRFDIKRQEHTFYKNENTLELEIVYRADRLSYYSICRVSITKVV